METTRDQVDLLPRRSFSMLAALAFALSFMTLPCQATLTDCLKLPSPPLHGKLVYVEGDTQARLKCADPKQDLTVNAPPFQGHMTCDPSSGVFGFASASRQMCLPYVKPIQLRSKARVVYKLGQKCSKSLKNDFKIEVEKHMKDVVSGDHTLYWSPINVTCNDVNVTASFLWLTNGKDHSNMSFDFFFHYSHYMSKMMRYMQYTPMPHIGTWREYHVELWEGVCANKSLTATVAALTGRHACRGCPKNMFMNADKFCERCGPGKYTRSYFADSCIDCSTQKHRKNESDYINNCL